MALMDPRLSTVLLFLAVACTPPSDEDGDGVPAGQDCDDTDAAIFPGAPEVCNGADDDCDGLTDEEPVDGQRYAADQDGDGYGEPLSIVRACAPGPGLTDDTTDCDDTNARIFPGAVEVCNDEDDDCDGLTDEDAADAQTFYADTDGDGHGDPQLPVEACTLPDGAAAWGDDCDDSRVSISPDAAEVWYDGVDQDCDGRDDDIDGDGYGIDEDCEDLDADISPGASELCNDGIDNNCDGGAPECGLLGSLSTSDARATWSGSSTASRAGQALARALDTDGDGVPELLIGAPYYSTSSYTTAGAAYVVDPRSADGDLDARAQAVLVSGARDYAGTALDAADIDGDGYDDVLVGAPQAGGPGGLYIAAGPLSGHTSLSSSARLLTASGTIGYAGNSLSAVDDLDGDGLPEVAVGAPYTSISPGYYQGTTYLLLSTGSLLADDASLSDAEIQLQGSTTSRFYGDPVQGLGDLDGDGRGDLAVSPRSGSEKVGIFTDLPEGTLTAADATFSFTGPAVLSRAGDLDSDGYDDLLVSVQGVVYGVLWPPGSSLSSAALRLEDASPSALAVAAALDSDSVPDILVGDEGSGRVYIIPADERGTLAIGDVAVARISDTGRTGLGSAVVVVGDTNADGFDELAVGAQSAASGAGEIYLFDGGGL